MATFADIQHHFALNFLKKGLMCSGLEASGPDMPSVVMYTSGRAGLPSEETTWAKMLLDQGYDTAAFGTRCKIRLPENLFNWIVLLFLDLGKWHLGWDDLWRRDQLHGPLGHGFGSFFGLPHTLVDGFELSYSFFTYSEVRNSKESQQN